MKDLRIGVLGAGGRGGLARNAHKPGEGSAVVACCDTNQNVFERMRTWYGPDVFLTTSAAELLKQDLDAVMICTPDFLHEKHAVAALKAEIPVYLEKPMAITIEGCDRILATARKKKVKLFVGHNMRYMTIIRKMKALIDEGRIGDEVHYGNPMAAGGHGGSDLMIVGEFLNYVRGDIDTTTATPQAARMAVAAGYQATLSLRNGGKPYDVPPLPENRSTRCRLACRPASR
ncbi:MAG TPA: hypothetical protein DCS43_10975 [Verrucomicrobia bacterium]|nr:hypothetical protein [Verrucomicrobiota bacterium]